MPSGECIAEIITTKPPQCVEFFHQRDAGPILLAYSWDKFVSVCVLHFPELEEDVQEFTYENLTDIESATTITHVAWSPNTSMLIHPVGLTLCAVGDDYQLKIFHINNKMEVTVEALGKHKSFVNDCSFEPSSGREVASVGDDKKCKIWDCESKKEIFSIPLTSAGKSVKWNANDLGKLLVGEQNGTIRMYDTFSYQPIFSVNPFKSNLTSLDWSPLNPQYIGCTADKHWFVWDTAKGSIAEGSGLAHVESTAQFRFSCANEDIFATRGRPGNEFKVYFNQMDRVVLNVQTKIGHGLTWHNLLPVVAVGGNNKIAIYDLQSV